MRGWCLIKYSSDMLENLFNFLIKGFSTQNVWQTMKNFTGTSNKSINLLFLKSLVKFTIAILIDSDDFIFT